MHLRTLRKMMEKAEMKFKQDPYRSYCMAWRVYSETVVRDPKLNRRAWELFAKAAAKARLHELDSRERRYGM